MALTPDSITKRHRKDLAQLRQSGRRIRAGLIVLVAVIILAPAITWWSDVALPTGGAARKALLISGGGWTRDLLQQQSEYRNWISYVALPMEVRLFEALSEGIFYSARWLGSEGDEGAFFHRVLVSIHFAILRVAFIVVACWKIWVLFVLGAFYLARDWWRPYEKQDMLGQTGNGRIFYSGIRAALENLDRDGRPGTQVTGLACVPQVSEEALKASSLYKLLERAGVANRTNAALAAMLLKFAHYPAYVADRSEGAKLKQAFSGATLCENAEHLLKELLTLHEELCSGARQVADGNWEAGGATEAKDVEQYAKFVAKAAQSVLTPLLRSELATISAPQVATMILALEAGKILAYGYEGEQWIRKSNFPQLSSRAVLHSLASFSEEYESGERTIIRNAIIYGSRRSVFAPVRLPRDMSMTARALRQWAELLIACPHELVSSAHEVELLGIVSEAHRRWEDVFFRELQEQKLELCQGAYSTLSNLALFPLAGLVRTIREVISTQELSRLEVLLTAVNQKQRLDALARDEGSDGAVVSRAVREHVVAPLGFHEMRDLSLEHAVAVQDVKDWSTMRVVLQMFGWLARRVGDYTVPPSSLILVAVSPEERSAECNDIGLIARSGMVPLRATRLIERFGKQWSLQLERLSRARMAMSREQLDRVMRGASDDLPRDDSESLTGGPGRE